MVSWLSAAALQHGLVRGMSLNGAHCIKLASSLRFKPSASADWHRTRNLGQRTYLHGVCRRRSGAKIRATRRNTSSCGMGSLPRTEEEPKAFRKENGPGMNSDANSIPLLTGRVGKASSAQKKRGLSRHYPSKAQSFDCIADLLHEPQFGDSAVVLSKAVSMRCMPSSALGRSLAAEIRRCNTTAALSEHSTVSEDSVANNWITLDEQSLCCAMQGANLQDTSTSQQEVPTSPP